MLDVDEGVSMAGCQASPERTGLVGPGTDAAQSGTGMRPRVGERGTRCGHHLGQLNNFKERELSQSW
jgi:hypothetical protein